MPITRRKRANPPDQPENTNTNNHLADQAENTAEALSAEQATNPSAEAENQASVPPASSAMPTPPATPGSGRAENAANMAYPSGIPSSVPAPATGQTDVPSGSVGNGERGERMERMERPDYNSTIESGRRTMRGEVFRRPPQPPVPPVAPSGVAAPLQAPSHEIRLPLGKEPGDTTGDPLHLAYNPGYTGSEEARGTLLRTLAQESRTGGRARCWSCGSLAIVYECWNTRNKSFGEIGVAYCEICGVWSVM